MDLDGLTVKFLNRRTFFKRLKYPKPGGPCYFWDALEELRSFYLPARTSKRQLKKATLALEGILRPQRPVFVFGDKIAGWSGVGRRRHSPAELARLSEALLLIGEHGHFRDKEGYVDNYYICDSTFSWFIVFCHESDWHIFITPRRSKRASFAAWVRAFSVCELQRRKPGF